VGISNVQLRTISEVYSMNYAAVKKTHLQQFYSGSRLSKNSYVHTDLAT